MNEFKSRTGNFSTAKCFYAPGGGDRASVFLEPLLIVCSTLNSHCNGAQFFVTAGCEEFDRNINCVDYCTKQVVNWRFFGTPLKRFIESKRVPLAKLPSHFMCVSIGLFWLGCRRMEVHDRCWAGYTRFLEFVTCVRRLKGWDICVQKHTNDVDQGCQITLAIYLSGWFKRVCVCVGFVVCVCFGNNVYLYLLCFCIVSFMCVYVCIYIYILICY